MSSFFWKYPLQLENSYPFAFMNHLHEIIFGWSTESVLRYLWQKFTVYLYPPPSTLSEMQVQFGLEDEGPDVDAAADSLDAFESSDDDEEDRETFAYLLADAWI